MLNGLLRDKQSIFSLYCYVSRLNFSLVSRGWVKLEFKEAKYTRIRQSLKLENPGYVVDQITLVMDVFGGYGRDLGENIGYKLLVTKRSSNLLSPTCKSP